MKLLLIPLLIIGMFVSFTAAMMAMLFFTETVKSQEELEEVLFGDPDSTQLSTEFIDPEDKLGHLIELMSDYRELYETELRRTEELRDSLLAEQAKVLGERESLDQERQQLGLQADSVRSKSREANVAQLGVFYNKLKAPAAAEILQAGTLSDTSVAMLMLQLQPQQMAKIMASMDAEFAARITQLMRDL